MPKRKRGAPRRYRPWIKNDLWFLRKEAGAMTVKQLAKSLGRTTSAVTQQASVHGISLRRAG